MSEAQKYYLTATSYLMEGEQLGRISVYLSSDYDQLKEKLWHSEMAAEAEAHRVDELKAENERMSDMITLVVDESNQHRKERDTLREELQSERDTESLTAAKLRQQLDEARGLLNLALTRDVGGSVRGIIDAWLEANK